MYLGVAYYPEHWDKRDWERDVRLMKEAGLNIVRLAEFAWSQIERTEGQFSLSGSMRCWIFWPSTDSKPSCALPRRHRLLG